MIVRRPLLILAALLTGAAPPPAGDPPVVRAADATAMFQGDGAAVKFDPACRDFDVTTLPSNPCAARVAAGETARSPTPYLYEFARRLGASDPPRALRTFLLARMRLTYDATRCADPAARDAIRAWDGLVAPDLGFALTGTPASRAAAARAALADEAALPGDTRPWWVCRSGMAAMTAALDHRPLPLALRPAAEWPALRAAARAPIEALAAAPR